MLSDADYGPFIVMDLVLGIPLSRYAQQYRQRSGQIPLKHVIELLRPVAAALDYAHVRGVLHRDVKPDNILVQTEPHFEVTLIDFGLAATIRSTMTRFTQASSDTRGTRPYMSPEQLRGNSLQWDGRTDQYSLAVVAYELLGGYLPFETEDGFALMYAVLHEQVAPIETCSDAVNQVLSRGLGKERAERYENCTNFINSFTATTTAFSSVSVIETTALQPRMPTPVVAQSLSLANKSAGEASAKSFVNSIGMKLVRIPAGTFLMGSPASEAGHYDNETQHHVTLTRDFYLGTTVVTQGEYEQVMGMNPSYFSAGGGGRGKINGMYTSRFPVEQVSWGDAVEYCRRLSALATEHAAGRVYRLPTEAEWEYACRAGTATPFHFGSQLTSRQANFNGNHPYGITTTGPYLERTATVGSYGCNGYGLFDMHGNVWEWCSDWYGDYTAPAQVDPLGAAAGSGRVNRGGGWSNYARDCRSALRGRNTPGNRDDNLGFRVALSSVFERSSAGP
jgi:formylglycine-generating enzyme required for sulfatase activity